MTSSKEVQKRTAQGARCYERLYGELSDEVHESSGAEVEGGLKKFLHDNLPQSERKEVEGELKKVICLDRGQKVGKKTRRVSSELPKKEKKGQYLTARERRALGLNRLPPRAKLCVDDLKELNSLWLEYIRKLIGKVNVAPNVPPPQADVIRTVGDEQLQMRIARADYHGALVKVSASANNTLVGTEGYVALETRNTVQIVTRKSRVKMVPKKGSTFSFRVDDLVFTVGGSNMCVKPSERAVKKWKTKPPFDL